MLVHPGPAEKDQSLRGGERGGSQSGALDSCSKGVGYVTGSDFSPHIINIIFFFSFFFFFFFFFFLVYS